MTPDQRERIAKWERDRAIAEKLASSGGIVEFIIKLALVLLGVGVIFMWAHRCPRPPDPTPSMTLGLRGEAKYRALADLNRSP